MSTTATTVVPAAPAIHPSWWAKAAAWVKHEAVVVKGVFQKIQAEMPAVQAEIQKIAPTVEGISNLIVPGSGTFEQHLLDVWGTVAATVDTAGDAATGNFVNVPLDAALVAQIKAFIPAVKAEMSPAANSAPAVPSGPPAPISTLSKDPSPISAVIKS